MNQHLKLAYEHGVQVALAEAGITKTANVGLYGGAAGLGLAALDPDSEVRDLAAGGVGAGLGALLANKGIHKAWMADKLPIKTLKGFGRLGLGASALGGLLGYGALRGMAKEDSLEDRIREGASDLGDRVDEIGEPSAGASILRGLGTLGGGLAGGMGGGLAAAGLSHLLTRGRGKIPNIKIDNLITAGGALAGLAPGAYAGYQGTKSLTDSPVEQLRDRLEG